MSSQQPIHNSVCHLAGASIAFGSRGKGRTVPGSTPDAAMSPQDFDGEVLCNIRPRTIHPKKPWEFDASEEHQHNRFLRQRQLPTFSTRVRERQCSPPRVPNDPLMGGRVVPLPVVLCRVPTIKQPFRRLLGTPECQPETPTIATGCILRRLGTSLHQRC